MNGYIRAPEVRVVAPDGSQIGIKKIREALWLADQLGLDLVEVAPDAKPPVCRLMDYGKYKYELSVKAREARKKQTRTVIKEVKFKPKIGEHDYLIKQRRTIEFLSEGDKVKVTIWFRGREAQRPELGLRILDRLAEEVADYGLVEQTPSQEGRNMTMVLGPVRRRDRPKAPEAAGRPAEVTVAPPAKLETPDEPEQPAEEVAPEPEAEEQPTEVVAAAPGKLGTADEPEQPAEEVASEAASDDED
ncbi:MAG: translation initiation factor IF-3 [Acidimicrobiia bacterium]|nr:translation initiation factor IF-3 [Acidimicrobiia bacterium]MDH3396203.1 translation initiation factor IF-3 [Acidimicrobiia bacterium]MDH5615220.1 translation initiation factor IF-3 [Acidimicrobiia bacterium]